MSLLRLIARLDIKGQNVVKGIQFEGLRVVGNPQALATKYAQEGADEILYIDTVASLYGRNQLTQLLEQTTEEVFIPVTVGRGAKSRADVQRLLRAGADKVAINTAALERPELIDEIASFYGSQAIVCSIEAKRRGSGWEAYKNNGRDPSGKCAISWASEAVERGAGEILITSIDQDGTRQGFDIGLVKEVSGLRVPVTASGGMGTLQHLKAVLEEGKADAVAMASVLHYGRLRFDDMRKAVDDRRTRILAPAHS